MAFHKDKTGTDNHVPYAYTYADAAARTSATGFVAADVGKLARQSDTNTLWMLTDDSPVTWVQVGSGLTGIVVGVTFAFGDGSAVIATTELAQYAEVPFAVTVTSWKAVSVDGTSGSINLPVYRATAGSPTTFTEISGTSDVGFSSATSGEDTNLSEWSDVTLDAGDIVRVGPPSTSPTSVKRVIAMLRMTRTV